MKKNYFFATIYKKIGWALFVPSAILVALHLFDSGIADWDFGACYTFSVIPTGIDDALASKDHAIGDLSFLVYNFSWMDEIAWVFSILSLIFIGFASEKDEDECTIDIRLKSLMWAVKTYAILFVASVLLVYGANFLVVLSLQPFVLFLLYIIKFYIELYKFRKETADEE